MTLRYKEINPPLFFEAGKDVLSTAIDILKLDLDYPSCSLEPGSTNIIIRKLMGFVGDEKQSEFLVETAVAYHGKTAIVRIISDIYDTREFLVGSNSEYEAGKVDFTDVAIDMPAQYCGKIGTCLYGLIYSNRFED